MRLLLHIIQPERQAQTARLKHSLCLGTATTTARTVESIWARYADPKLSLYGFFLFVLSSKIQRTHVLAICKFVLNSIPESIQKPFWRLISRPWNDKKIPLEVRRIRRHRAVPNQKFRTRGTTFSSTDTKTAPTTIHLQQPTYQWAIHKAHSIRFNQPLLHAENIRYGLYA